MRYLGVTLDGKWSFREHFRVLVPRLNRTAFALGSLLPNLRGPSAACRCLYMGVIKSMALYGAPIWEEALRRDNVALLRQPQRAIARRVARCYRTVSYDAVCVLAGAPPWDLEARVLAYVYRRSAELRSLGRADVAEEIRHERSRAQDVLMDVWEVRLAEPSAGHRTVEAIRPVLREWIGRRHGAVTFRLAQVLSGHGCFGRYLCRVARREPTEECHHCGSPEDTAQHTLAECCAWAEERSALVSAIGADLSLPAVVAAMLESEGNWGAVLSFCEQVMLQKEQAERQREDVALDDPLRRRRAGGRRRAHARDLPS